MKPFTPPECPYCHVSPPIYRCRGFYRRKCDTYKVPRFQCLSCMRRFSRQTFRNDYRYHRPHINVHVAQGLISKVTLRQIARTAGCNLKTVARRVPLLRRHFELVQQNVLASKPNALSADGNFFVFDELETFEQNRIEKPLTVPVVIEGNTGFVIHSEVGTLPPRRKCVGAPERKNESPQVVLRCLQAVAKHLLPQSKPYFVSDKKSVYIKALELVFPQGVFHRRVASDEPRNCANPLFRINHTFAMMRDNISRLVRRNWGHSKLAARQADHNWIYTGYRNFVRPITNRCVDETPASRLGLVPRLYTLEEAIAWRGRLAI